jgi:hypothetical protein
MTFTLLVCLAMLATVVLLVPGTAQAETIRGHGSQQGHGGHGGGGGSYGGHHHYYYGGGFGFSASYYYLPSYSPYGYYYSPYPAYYGSMYLPDIAYIDTDVSPENAEVILDGDSVGIADDFDGFPRYLAVTPGRHTIEFRAPGHKIMTRSLRVPRGSVLEIEFTMPEGSGAVTPRDAKGDARGDEEIVVPEYRRGEETRGGRRVDSNEGDDREVQEAEPEEDDVEEAEPGFLRLDVTPPDASVYIDGKLYGSASRLSQLHGDLRLDVGRHKVEVVRPGYRSITRQINVTPGDHVNLDLDLERSVNRPPPPR